MSKTKSVGNNEKIETSLPSENVENVENQKTDETPKPETIDEKIVRLTSEKRDAEKKLANVLMSDDSTDDEKNAAVIAQQKAKNALRDILAEKDKLEKDAQISAAKSAKRSMLIALCNAAIENDAFQKSGADIDAKNAANAAFNTQFDVIAIDFEKTITLHIPMGMSGKTLEKKLGDKKAETTGGNDKTSKRAQIWAKLDSGMTVDQIAAENEFTRKEISDNKWHWEKRND